MKKNNKHVNTVLVLILLAGLSLLLYPTVSNYWNSFHQSRAINDYTDSVTSMDTHDYEEMIEEAQTYNTQLYEKGQKCVLDETELARYEDTLDITGTGIMAYVEIPRINVSLPVYHGTEDSVLQVATGHVEWTSLPVGGESTHCVISGHRGLPSAKLFTNLDRLEVGDQFLVHVMDDILTYEVDQILIVEPDDIDALKIEEGKDLFTLVTCTPYGINTHRLLVRGHRVETVLDSTVRVVADAGQIEPMLVAPVLAVPILLVLLIVVMIPKKRR